VAQQSEAQVLARPAAVAGRSGLRRTLAAQEGMIIGTVSVVAFLLFWEWVGTSGVINPMFSSSPSRIIKAGDRLFFDGGIGAVFAALFAGNVTGAWTAIAKGSIWKDMWVSGQELFWGYGLCLVVGIPFGLALGWFRRLSYIFEPFISALYATPSVALLPLYIIWFGIGINSKIAVIFMSGIFYVLIYARVGVTTVDANILKCARSFGASDLQLIRTVVMPSSVPFLFTGARLSLGRALVGVVVGELYASKGGIGFYLNRAGQTFQTDKYYVAVVVIALIGVLFVYVLQRLEKRFARWRIVQ
jgi:ABC-type nitrate/sulfonate/bicarbonate transport system permease component